MANCSLKTGISARNLQIGIADSRKRHAHDGFAIADRLCHLSDLQFAILVTQSLHFFSGLWSLVFDFWSLFLILLSQDQRPKTKDQIKTSSFSRKHSRS